MKLTLALLLLAVTAAEAAPCAKRDAIVDRLSTGGNALLFCTGDTCWWLDTKSLVVRPINTLGPIPTYKEGRAAFDVDAENALPKQVTFCPTKDCATFPIPIKEEPIDAPVIVMNRAGTLGAIRWVGRPERGLPVWDLLFDLANKKSLGEHRRSPGWVYVFADTFLVDQTIVSGAYKQVGSLPTKELLLRATHPNETVAAFVNPGAKQVVLVDMHAGKVLQTIAMPIDAKDVDVSMELLFSRDGARLFVVAGFPLAGETWIIDTATGAITGHAAPPACK